jgi:hypothetical protein
VRRAARRVWPIWPSIGAAEAATTACMRRSIRSLARWVGAGGSKVR